LVSKQLLETLCIKEGTIQNLYHHQQRLDQASKDLGFTKRHTLSSLIEPPQSGCYRCRVLYDDTHISIEYLPYIKRHISTLQALNITPFDYHLKYADRSKINHYFDQRHGADDILMIVDGLVTDTSIANIAFFDGDRWLTPKAPLLKGTMRSRLLESHKIFEAEIPYEEIERFERFALMNAMIGFEIIKDGIILPLK